MILMNFHVQAFGRQYMNGLEIIMYFKSQDGLRTLQFVNCFKKYEIHAVPIVFTGSNCWFLKTEINVNKPLRT